MRRIFLAAIVCCALSGVVSLAAEKQVDQKPPAPTTKPATQPATPINKFCAVETDNEVDPTVPTVVYKGKVIGFCCEDCIPIFNKNPEMYMKTLK